MPPLHPPRNPPRNPPRKVMSNAEINHETPSIVTNQKQIDNSKCDKAYDCVVFIGILFSFKLL